jgi:hypothetical protein
MGCGRSIRPNSIANPSVTFFEKASRFSGMPVRGAFSILGFDTAEQTYVWLVTSIIRDPRLIRIPYQGEDVIIEE